MMPKYKVGIIEKSEKLYFVEAEDLDDLVNQLVSDDFYLYDCEDAGYSDYAENEDELYIYGPDDRYIGEAWDIQYDSIYSLEEEEEEKDESLP